jgi:hypothetical protein
VEEGGDVNLTKKEDKQMKKILKEQDKLEKQALIMRMQERDKTSTKQHIGTVVENQDV